MNTEIYENPLTTRYASDEMKKVFSDGSKFRLWRRLWIALAESEKELGLEITDEQIEDLKKYAEDINFEEAAELEKQVRHDVMAHVLAYGKQAEKAKGIIHLGATSCFVGDNADLIMIDNAIDVVMKKLLSVINNLKNFALKYKSLPTLGFTHFQAAQLTTVGKRACLWLNDLISDYKSLKELKNRLELRGVKGTTGTQASFMDLFDGDEEKVKKLEKLVVGKMGYKKVCPVTGQTYSRKFDYLVLSTLSQIAQSAYKFSNDIRLLQHEKEIEEPFEKSQIGSSAMAYKRNPMRSERMGALCRFVISLPTNTAITSSTQWLERTLDDSANKRIVIPQAFLAIDGILRLYLNVSENLVVYEKMIEKHVAFELPFMATENIIMECVKAGGDRQILHEEIRKLSMKAGENVKIYGKENNLLDLIRQDELFNAVKDKLSEMVNPSLYIGRAPGQVDDFINECVNPILTENINLLGEKGEISL
ncbi:MAG: adenylosuccinate lyase [Clostridia bacterium]|nr:adenylosuccinate lyase [Clostridia bacterium]